MVICMKWIESLQERKNIYETPLRVTFYARVSTENELQLTSIINQVDYFKNYINNNEYWTYVPGYVDEGISGKSVKKRDNFLKMMIDAKDGMFDLILTKSVSRFARNTIDSIRYTDILLGYGVGVFFLNDNINTIYSDSEFRLTLMASIAQDELRKLSESVQFGLGQSIQRGVVLGNNNILGYKKNKGKLEIIEDEAVIVRDIFYLFSMGGYNYLSLSNLISDKYGIKIDSKRVKRILTNYKYKGYYCGKKSRVIDYKKGKRILIDKDYWIIYKDNNNIPPIVDEKLWDKINKMVENKERNHRFFSKYKDFVYCNIHKSYLRVKMKKYKDNVYSYVVCPNCISIKSCFLDQIISMNIYCKVVLNLIGGSLVIECQS